MGTTVSKRQVDPDQVSTEVALAEYYDLNVRPLEKRHLYADFYSPPMDPAEFSAKPSVLLLGQYSVGKTSLITYLLGRDYPGASIGPEPTTDVFVFLQHGKTEQSIPGPVLVSDSQFPFRTISKFSTDFLNKMRGVTLDAAILKHVNFIDTPGILSGEKQRGNRGYDFHKVVKFLAEKVDSIWVLFDTSKMDISDEYKLVLSCLKGNDEKVRIILNKADSITAEELVRVRGALMWNLGKIFLTPEVPPVLIGSFINQPPKRNDLREVFLADYKALVKEVRELPIYSPIRKISDLVKRARKVETHALVMEQILRRGPNCFCQGRKGAIRKWTKPNKLKTIYADLEVKEKVQPHDFPDVEEFAASAALSDPAHWARIQAKERANLKTFLSRDITRIVDASKQKAAPTPAPESDVGTPTVLVALSPEKTDKEDKEEKGLESDQTKGTETLTKASPSNNDAPPSSKSHEDSIGIY